MPSIKDFFLSNPLGVLVLAVIAAAAWDLLKYFYLRLFNLTRRVEKHLNFMTMALARIENGTFLARLLFLGVMSLMCVLAVITSILFAVITILRPEKFGAYSGSPSQYFCLTAGILSFVALNHSLQEFAKLYIAVSYPKAELNKLSEQLERLPQADSSALAPQLARAIKKANDLGGL